MQQVRAGGNDDRKCHSPEILPPPDPSSVSLEIGWSTRKRITARRVLAIIQRIVAHSFMSTVKIEGLDRILHKAEDADNSALYDE